MKKQVAVTAVRLRQYPHFEGGIVAGKIFKKMSTYTRQNVDYVISIEGSLFLMFSVVGLIREYRKNTGITKACSIKSLYVNNNPMTWWQKFLSVFEAQKQAVFVHCRFDYPVIGEFQESSEEADNAFRQSEATKDSKVAENLARELGCVLSQVIVLPPPRKEYAEFIAKL